MNAPEELGKGGIVDAAIAYAGLGWRVVPVAGKIPCGGPAWQQAATRDPGEAAILFDESSGDGVGVLLGPGSGIIDLECDSEQAETELGQLFGGQIPATPTFQSSRGLHRLFRWTDALPASERSKAKFNFGAIEFRIGGGDRAAQTVFPPSPGRRWVIDPADCQVAELPAAVLVEIATRITEARAARRPQAITPPASYSADDRLDVTRWLARRGVEVYGVDESSGLARWFIRCPREEQHTTKNSARDCVVTQDLASGKLGGNCFHSSCGCGDWYALSEAIGKPEWIDFHPDHVDEPILHNAVAAIMSQNERRQEAVETADDDEPEEVDEFGDLTSTDFPSECLTPDGLLAEVMAHCLRSSLYPQPELSLAGALALLGTVTGRKVTDCYGTRTNVYVLGLGLSGCGKEQARRTNKDLLLRSLGEKLIGSERVGSHAGIVTTIHDQPATLMQLDEMGRLLETMKDPRKAPHLYNCITVLMQLYSSSGTIWKADAYADAKKVKTIDQPHLCVYGTATPDSFWHSLSTDNIAEGLIGRLLVFEGRGYEVTMQQPSSEPPPQEMIDAIRWWIEFRPGGNLGNEHPRPVQIPHTREARERFDGHVAGINERRRNEHPLRAAVWSRSAEKVAKLALLHACSRSRTIPTEIIYEDVNWGVTLGNWLTRRLLLGCASHVSENEIEAKAKRVLSMIPSSGITLEKLCRRTQWLRARERQEIVSDLVGCGIVVSESVPSKGRPRTLLRRR